MRHIKFGLLISTFLHFSFSSIAPPSVYVCAEETVNLTEFVTKNALGTPFSWCNANMTIGLGSVGVGKIPTFRACNPATEDNVSMIHYTTIDANGRAHILAFNLVVRPKPFVVLLDAPNTTICNAKPFNQTLMSCPKGATFSLTKDNGDVGLLASATSKGLIFTIGNDSKVQKVVNIVLTPTLNGCVGTSKVLPFTVLPTPSVNQPTDLVMCSGDAIPSIFSAAIAETTFHWTNDNPAVGIAPEGIGPLNQWKTHNETGLNQVANITVTPRLNGCYGAPKVFKITVKPAPILRTTAFSFCTNDSAVMEFKTNLKVPTDTKFNWVSNNVNTGVPPAGDTKSLMFKALSNRMDEVITTRLTVRTLVEGCSATTMVAVNIKPLPVLYNPGNLFIEGGQRVGVRFTTNMEGTKIDWTNTETAIGLPRRGVSDIYFTADMNASNRPIVAKIMAIASLDGCSEQAQMFSLTLLKAPSVTTPLATVQNGLSK